MLCHSRGACGLKNAFGVIPWLDHGIQTTIKNTNNFSIFNWIPLQARGMTGMESIHTTMPRRNDMYNLSTLPSLLRLP
jgi:hypothetical protein